jgi:hypothetical protein
MKSTIDHSTRERYYLGALESPGAWLLRGSELKSAAERLDWKTRPATEDERGFSHFHEYSMLLGMSFEALIKGHIARGRLRSLLEPTLLPKHFTHDLSKLAREPECSRLSLTSEELDALDNLSPFIEWTGRYPLPKSASKMEVGFGIGDDEYELQKRLWDRVFASLKDDAWVMKGGPHRLGGFKKQIGRVR